MGDANQMILIRKHAALFDGPFLEVGSKDYGSTGNLRPMFAGGGEYIGADMEPGDGVDVVVDFTSGPDEIDSTLGGRRFGTIFCLSVLEHCELPFVMAENLTHLLRAGGRLCVSVPFAWRYHGYPRDYWRFTHEGVKKLFPKLEFDPNFGAAATSRVGEFADLDEEIGRIPFSSKWHRERGHWLRGVTASLLRMLSRVGLLRWLCGYRYVMAPTHIFMIGELPGE